MGINPGNFASAMPPRESDAARKQRDLARTQRESAVARSLAASQLGVGGTLTVDGALVVNGSITTPGTLNSAGAVNAGTSMSAGTTFTAGGNITGGGLISNGGITAVGGIGAGGGISAASVTTTGDIASSGTVTSANAFVSPGSRATVVTVGYVNAYLDGDGVLGYQPSTRRVKKDLQAVPDVLGDALLGLTPYLGRYEWDDASTPLKVFLIAEDVQEAGFGPDVVPLDAEGNPATVNSQNLIPVLLSLIKRQDARIRALELASAGN